MNNPSKVLDYHEAIGNFPPSVTPECFNRGSSPEIRLDSR
jgi:hypothetical protein